jgi:hypothetical protein
MIKRGHVIIKMIEIGKDTTLVKKKAPARTGVMRNTATAVPGIQKVTTGKVICDAVVQHTVLTVCELRNSGWYAG